MNLNYEKIIDLLVETKIEPTVIIVTELWISEDQRFLFNIPNYQLVLKKSKQRAGGTGIFVRQGFEFQVVNTFDMHLTDCEDIWVKLQSKQRTCLIVGSVYRHPNYDYKSFETKFGNVLDNLSSKDYSYVIGGDFNIDLYKNNTNTLKYKNFIRSYGCSQLVNQPTRYSHQMTPAILDHVYTNIKEDQFK